MGWPDIFSSKWMVLRALIALTAFRNPCSSLSHIDARYTSKMLSELYHPDSEKQSKLKDRLMIFDLVVNQNRRNIRCLYGRDCTASTKNS